MVVLGLAPDTCMYHTLCVCQPADAAMTTLGIVSAIEKSDITGAHRHARIASINLLVTHNMACANRYTVGMVATVISVSYFFKRCLNRTGWSQLQMVGSGLIKYAVYLVHMVTLHIHLTLCIWRASLYLAG